MDDQRQFSERIQRTWIALLLEADARELAALVVDAELSILRDDWGNYNGIYVDLPPSSFRYVDSDNKVLYPLEKMLRLAVKGHLTDSYGNDGSDCKISFRVKLVDVEDDWRAIVRNLITKTKDSNQGLMTEKAFSLNKKQVLSYNDIKFASQSEIRIAQELERRRVLYFPLALAVRNDTGDRYKDHREVDFLVCHQGAWGILEVSRHVDRYELDAEKVVWFKKSGVSCIQHYAADRCYDQAAEVVDEFLSILAQHKR